MLKLHSSVRLITNSSTSIYTIATKETIKAAIKLLEAIGGNKDEFDFQLYPGESLVEAVIGDAEEYLDDDMRKMLKTKDWKNGITYVGQLIFDKKIEYPEIDYNDMDHEWELIVTRNGEPFTEFVDFFKSFNQEAVYG